MIIQHILLWTWAICIPVNIPAIYNRLPLMMRNIYLVGKSFVAIRSLANLSNNATALPYLELSISSKISQLKNNMAKTACDKSQKKKPDMGSLKL